MAEICIEVATYGDEETGEPYVVVIFSGFESWDHAQQRAAAIYRSIASTANALRLN